MSTELSFPLRMWTDSSDLFNRIEVNHEMDQHIPGELRTDAGMYLHAGPEIGVASTKAFTCQADGCRDSHQGKQWMPLNSAQLVQLSENINSTSQEGSNYAVLSPLTVAI